MEDRIGKQDTKPEFNFDQSFAELFGDDKDFVSVLPEPIIEDKNLEVNNMPEYIESVIQPDTQRQAEFKPTERKHSRTAKRITGILFYAAVAAAVLIAFLFSAKDGNPRNILGYSYFTVLSGSMQREIPKGSIVITKKTDPSIIQVGEDITYFKNAATTVTHRVIEIYENYEDSGVRGFRTKGLENPQADPDIVYASNVVGVVKFHTAGVGAFLSYIAKKPWVVIGLFAVFLALSFTLRMFLGETKKGKPMRSG